MKIIQIAPIVENWCPEGDYRQPNEEATVYGLGDDGKVYFWARTKTTRIKQEPNEENEFSDHRYEYEHGWRLYLP